MSQRARVRLSSFPLLAPAFLVAAFVGCQMVAEADLESLEITRTTSS